jgi:hypothetical protein
MAAACPHGRSAVRGGAEVRYGLGIAVAVIGTIIAVSGYVLAVPHFFPWPIFVARQVLPATSEG